MQESSFSRYGFKWPIKIEIKIEFLKYEPASPTHLKI